MAVRVRDALCEVWGGAVGPVGLCVEVVEGVYCMIMVRVAG